MSKKEDAFVEQYFIQRFNGTKAAIAAGYAPRSAHVTASRLLRKAKVSAAITERLADLKMTADEVLINLSEQGRGSMADFVNFGKKGDKPFIDLKQAMERGQLHLVKKLKITEKHGNVTEFTTEIELYDKQAANTLLGKYHRLFAEKLEIDWAAELKMAGLDANVVENELTELFKQHLLSGAAGVDREGADEGEAPG